MSLSVVILAAGASSRMHSCLSKMLHPLGGQPILGHVVETARALQPAEIFIVYGQQGEQMQQSIQGDDLQWVELDQPLGTGYAAARVMPLIKPDRRVLILFGDIPLLSAQTLQRLIATAPKESLGLLLAEFANPYGLGRIVQDDLGNILGIVEEKDASDLQRQIKLIFSGVMLAPQKAFAKWLPQVNNKNAQSEYYLTDVVGLAVQEGLAITGVTTPDAEEVRGVNDRAQLAELERLYQQRVARDLMLSGVTLKDPARFDLRGELTAAEDVVIDINVVIEGNVSLASGVYVGPNTVLRDVTIGENTQIKANCVLEAADIGMDCSIGPFARIRPGTQLAEQVRIGNFVEIKKSQIGHGTKISHLSYIGDATLGSEVNIGAGTITCNYDGVSKHPTVIQDKVFIGADSQLVAPVTIGAGATIGAGSTITQDAPAAQLTLSRTEQETIKDWQRPDQKTEQD